MRYRKQPLTFEQQADRLIERGLSADRPALIRCLSEVNYYRLSGYLVSRIAPQSKWRKRLAHLWESKHPSIPIADMGFPENWKDSPIWQD